MPVGGKSVWFLGVGFWLFFVVFKYAIKEAVKLGSLTKIYLKHC